MRTVTGALILLSGAVLTSAGVMAHAVSDKDSSLGGAALLVGIFLGLFGVLYVFNERMSLQSSSQDLKTHPSQTSQNPNETGRPITFFATRKNSPLGLQSLTIIRNKLQP